MRYLNRYKIFENKQDIELLCKKYSIANYTIGSDLGVVNVNGDVDLSNRELGGKLPLKFGSGEFRFTSSPIYSIVSGFIRKPNKNELIELFNDTDIIQGDKIIYDRLVWFFEEIGVDLPNLDKDIISKNYKIIR